jgi:hypothetical protein
MCGYPCRAGVCGAFFRQLTMQNKQMIHWIFATKDIHAYALCMYAYTIIDLGAEIM